MCGRFSLFTQDAIVAEYFGIDNLNELMPRYNIAPTQDTLMIRQNREGHREGVVARWGLVPSWTKAENISGKLINARVETAHQKPSFRSAFKKHRCLVPANGFYEWQPIEGSKTKQPYHITMADHQLMAFAGLWECWQQDDREIVSCTLLTRDANKQMMPIHHRMPVLLTPENFDAWLDIDNVDTTAIHDFITHVSAPKLTLTQVSLAVNNPRVDGPECIAEQA